MLIPFTCCCPSALLQMLSLMDRLLKRENLDLRLTPYRCDSWWAQACCTCRQVSLVSDSMLCPRFVSRNPLALQGAANGQ